MSRDRLSEAEARYGAVVEALRQMPGVTQHAKKGFSFGGLMVGGRLFAILRRDELLLKLPRPRVAALIASGHGCPFGASRGQPMKEWVTVKMSASEDWADLAEEAMCFVSS